jgi:hypothetical protein
MRLFFLTRSYLPEITGGTQIRSAQVRILVRQGFDVTVVTPNYKGDRVVVDGKVLRLPGRVSPFAPYFERLGFCEDYLDAWVKSARQYLVPVVRKKDIVFATSGGELGNIKLGSLLKASVGCTFVVNFHDPLDFSLVNGLKLQDGFHLTRDRQEARYLANADLVVTTSLANRDSLQKKYAHLADRIRNSFFGYIEKSPLVGKKPSRRLRIAYGGAFTKAQAPETLARIAEKSSPVDVFFIGDSSEYGPLKAFRSRFNFIDRMDRSEYARFLMENIDVGFLCLRDAYLGACVPSKLFEYINLGIPILGALPPGDARTIINGNQYGIACDHDDYNTLGRSLDRFRSAAFLDSTRARILQDRDSWSMEERIRDVVSWLRELCEVQ